MKSRICFFLLLPLSVLAQSNWTGSSDGIDWHNAGNWNPSSVPTSTSNVVINVTPEVGLAGELYPSDRVVGLTNAGTNIIQSFEFGVGLSSSIKIIPLSSEALQVNGSITNSSSFNQIFALPVYAGANGTWTGPLTYANTVNVNTNTVTLVGTHNFTGNNLNFTLNDTSLTGYGRLGGSFTMNFSGTINIDATAYVSTAVAGHTFDFTTGNFSGVTLVNITPLSGGLTWNTSNFLTNGTLTVSAVPEPSTYAALFGLAALGFCSVRRRREG